VPDGVEVAVVVELELPPPQAAQTLTKASAAAKTQVVRRWRRSTVAPRPRTPRTASQSHGPGADGARGAGGAAAPAVVLAVTVTAMGPLSVSDGCEIEQVPAGMEAAHDSVTVWLKPPVGVRLSE